tara:strand:- start:5989 stop:6351 length:363 start_codon:yes stop_codon:yes gene_type:complete
VARPTSYTEEIALEAWAYLDGGWEEAGHAVPSVVGLCAVLNRGKSTIYDWAQDPEKEFSDILSAIKEKQELVTFNRALRGDYNAAIAKLLLGKHGYHDKQDTMQTNVDMTHEEWLSNLDE